ncbi:hypothetical protein PRIPAC_95376 [Pristionchus pacificus]|uniref:G protein-coupled receptor n=1 Tax=Pristionchus pacificus TaxID=54126 RepID=A0A2A6D3A2_PRIPA|nr:hypothetical protein PRIPAC_95376 [Pristionchus pacificus]|eukprot:PDM84763.1 G protein-coupled receptor [Pristionchus pacificus]
MVAQFLFLTERMAAPEYDCSAHSPDEWSRIHGKRQYIMGIWSIFLGCLTWVLYVPAIRYFFREKRFTCIKIMRVLALVDMVAILCDGTLFGIQMLQGAVFCSHKIFIVMNGFGGYAAWNVSSCLCVFLVVNRILEMAGKEKWFQERVAQHDCDCCCYVLRHCSCIILSASTYKFRVSDNALLPIYSRSRLQSSKHVHYSVQRSNHFQYVNYAHVLHNLSICLLISAFFIVLCAMIKSHSSQYNISSNLKKIQAQAHIYASADHLHCERRRFVWVGICELQRDRVYFTSWILLNVIPTPQIVITIVMVSCQFIYASPSMIYISMNPNIQREFKKMLRMKPGNAQSNTATSTAATPISVM